MICVLCKGSVMKQKVEEEVAVGKDHILVIVEAEVCENCHERYFPEGTVDYLQKLRKDLQFKRELFRAVGQVYQSL